MIDTAAISSTASTTGFTLFILLTVITIVLTIGLAIAFMLYKRTFNIDVFVMKYNDNGVEVNAGLRGKIYIKGEGTAARFKIWGAKRHKILYHEEAIQPENIYNQIIGNRVKRIIFMSPDSEGFLHPLKVTPEVITLKTKVYNKEKQEEEEVIEQRKVLKSTYTALDNAWLQTEAEKYNNMFDTRSAAEKWGFIIIVIVLIITLVAFLWVAHKVSANSAQMAEASQLLAETVQIVYQNQTGIQQNTPFIRTITG